MLTDLIHQKIARFIEALNPEVFVVDLHMKRGKRNVLILRLDTDKGISMAECGSIGRKLGPWLEEESLFNMEYGLEVSSPGIGEPLKMSRQYHKNIGRMLRVALSAGGEVVGKLGSVTDDHIEVLPYKKSNSKDKSRKPQFEESPRVISWEDIGEAKVILKIE